MINSPLSPGFRNLGGFWPNPTPAGVPVAIISPGRMVLDSDIVLTSFATENMRSSVVASWRFSPLTKVCIRRVLGRSLAGTAIGPIGQNVSGDFPI